MDIVPVQEQKNSSNVSKLEVVTLGETMVLIFPLEIGPLRHVQRFSKSIGGAESNVAIGLSRLGHKVGWVSRVGQDEFGDYILSFLRGEGVEVSQVLYDPQRPTGIYFKEFRSPNLTRVYYYRKGSAVSYMRFEDLDLDYLFQGKILHLTGITPALSASSKELIFNLMNESERRETKISFDVNLRLSLWGSLDPKQILIPLISESDILFIGIDEAEYLFDCADQKILEKNLANLGPKTVILKMGEVGAVSFQDGERFESKAFPVKRVVDKVGSGDAFAAGYISGILRDLSPDESLNLANAVATFALSVPGDVEALPTLTEIENFITGGKGIER